jgi:hypothetical protein
LQKNPYVFTILFFINITNNIKSAKKYALGIREKQAAFIRYLCEPRVELFFGTISNTAPKELDFRDLNF